jgi:hypothetical protein
MRWSNPENAQPIGQNDLALLLIWWTEAAQDYLGNDMALPLYEALKVLVRILYKLAMSHPPVKERCTGLRPWNDNLHIAQNLQHPVLLSRRDGSHALGITSFIAIWKRVGSKHEKKFVEWKKFPNCCDWLGKDTCSLVARNSYSFQSCTVLCSLRRCRYFYSLSLPCNANPAPTTYLSTHSHHTLQPFA